MDKSRRITVFAHYDKDNIIDDYVIYYLKFLKEISDKIIFVSACNLSDNEREKIKEFTDLIIAEKHNEYDFGSYKRGYLYIKDKNFDFEELIFANDSCYGPVFSLNKIFTEMESKICDFWSMTENQFGINYKSRHLQTYFIVFKINVFNCNIFYIFIVFVIF